MRRSLLEVGADNLNHVLGSLFGGLRILGHVVEDVIFHQFAHQAVDGAPGGREAVKDLGALLVVIQAFENRLELTDDFLWFG